MVERKSKSGTAYPLQKLSSYYSSPISLEKDNRHSGLFAWLILLAYVISYDTYAVKTKKSETLTRSFWRLSEGKISKGPVLGAWLVVTFHLMFEKKFRRRIYK